MAGSETFVIGIDLGTTNSSLAFIDLRETDSRPKLLAIPQWENDEQSIEDHKLPSFLWLLPKNILKKGLKSHPSFESFKTPYIIGRSAREKALTEPLQVVHSAKSWLSSGPLTQRNGSILPWGSPDEKLSPVAVQTALLEHLKYSWDSFFPGFPFNEQRIVITVPASFDELAQRLTLEAADRASYPKKIELLEEPLAAYYDWESQNSEKNGRVLVCDVGGGTSDFTLLQRGTRSERLKVSEHLLLGGDNIDLALARRLSLILSPDSELPRAAWNILLAQTRRLKEDALSLDSEETFHLSLPLDPRNLFGKYLTASVHASELRAWILDDFFPLVEKTDRPEKASGLQNWGLPYAKDSRITRHLAEFLDGNPVDFVLCVGGTLLPQSLQDRILMNVRAWQDRPAEALLSKDSDLAIAYGAALFGARRARAQELVHSPYPRELLIEVEDKNKNIARDLCLLPKGHPRMTPYQVATDGLHLRLGQEVRFQIVSMAADGQKTTLAPLVLKLDAAGKKDLIPVRLESSVRETGVLEVSCHGADGQKWILDFAVEGARAHMGSSGSGALPLTAVPGLNEIKALVKKHYERQSALRIDLLPSAIEEIWKLPRDAWTADHLRGLWPALEAVLFNRALSAEHEAMWFYLAGFCLRPGFGYQGDEERMTSLLRIYDESFRRVEGNNRLLTQWWILWRRTAGGLPSAFQQKLFDRYILSVRKDKDISPELMRLLASLERLERNAKEQLGRLLLNQLRDGVKSNADTRVWSLARLASRYPIYASPAHVLSPSVVEEWADDLGRIALPSKARPALFYAWAGRLRGDKQYDIDPRYRIQFLEKVDHPEWRKALSEVVAPDTATQSQMLADTLPSGFVFSN